MKALLHAASEDHDHLGARRPRPHRAGRSRISSRILDRALERDPELKHVYFDISWDEVAKYIVATPGIDQRAPRDLINAHPGPLPVRHGRSRAGRRAGADQGLRHVCAAVEAADAGGEREGAQGNYERLFDEGGAGAGVGEGERQMNGVPQDRVQLSGIKHNFDPRRW